jgi:ribokinase
MKGPIVIGAINWDTILFVKRFPGAGEEAVVQQITEVPGGKAGNTAVAAARLLGRDRAVIFGALGNDSIATEQIRIFKQEGVVVTGLKHTKDRRSGQAYIAVDETGENKIYTHFGANATVTADDLDDPVRRKLISEASVITIMDPPLETATKMAEIAKQFGIRVTFDPGVKSQMRLEGLQPILKNTDFLVSNESEIRYLTGTENPARAAEILRKDNPKLKVVTKLGARGSIEFYPAGQVCCEALDLQSLGMKVTNTVGCGDAFLGAFSAALSEDLPDLEALKWGSCAAGLKATKPETRGSPNRETLTKYVQQVKIRKQSS